MGDQAASKNRKGQRFSIRVLNGILQCILSPVPALVAPGGRYTPAKGQVT